MIDPKEVEAHASQLRSLFGRSALLEAGAKELRQSAREAIRKADAMEREGAETLAKANALVAKGPCGCGGGAKAPAATLAPETVAAPATVASTDPLAAPVESLRLTGKLGEAIDRLGVKTVGELATKTEKQIRASANGHHKVERTLVNALGSRLKALGLSFATEPVEAKAPQEAIHG